VVPRRRHGALPLTTRLDSYQPARQPATTDPPIGAGYLVTELREQIAYLRELLRRSLRAEAEIRRLLAAEQQRRVPAPVETVVAPTGQPCSSPAAAPPRRPWWRFRR
jgi:hypothetical protein